MNQNATPLGIQLRERASKERERRNHFCPRAAGKNNEKE
jgi:hypothetical protein